MTTPISESLHSAISVGVREAFATFTEDDMDALMMGPYLELQEEYVAGLRLAA